MRIIYALLFPVCMLSVAAPPWVNDPANSRWITFGGETGITETSGISLRPSGSEGVLQGAQRAGVDCAQSVLESGKLGYFYLVCEPWAQLKAWLDGSDLVLTVRYYDGDKGTLIVQYDSSDERVKLPPYPAGVWKKPPAFPNGIALTGDRTWKTLQIQLPFAFFMKRLHGGDIRLNSIGGDMALAGVAISRTPHLEEGQLAGQQLRVATCEGMSRLGAGAHFAGTFRQSDAGTVVMEAENATTLDVGVGYDLVLSPEASGGAAIHHVTRATWQFTMVQGGTYQVWQRSSFPWKGYWNHAEGMDAGAEQTISDSTGEPAPGWVWVRAGRYSLEAGEHTFRLAYQGGARLDVVVIAPVTWVPPDTLASLSTDYEGAYVATILMEPVKPLQVKQWQSLSVQVAGSPQTTLEVSNGEKDAVWLPANKPDSLTKLPVHGDGTDSLQVRLMLRGSPGHPPLLAAAQLHYIAGPDNVRVAENPAWRIGFDATGIAWIEDKRRGTRLAQAPDMHAALLSLTVKPPGPSTIDRLDLYQAVLKDVEVTPADASGVCHVMLVHAFRNGLRATTRAAFLPDGQSTWKLEIQNDSPLEVAELRFPLISGIALGENADDDWITVSKPWGQVWQNPSKDRLSTFWGTSMRWLGMWDQTQGLYLGIEDPHLDDYGFIFGGDAAGTTLAPAQRVLVKPGQNWGSGTYRLALVAGETWHPAADIYRDYVAHSLAQPSPPPHLVWLMDRWTTQDSNRAPVAGWDMIRPDGQVLMAANRQMLDGPDSGYCGLFPYPSPVWGSLEEFQQKLRVLHANGELYTPYHNFHLWAPGYGHYDRIGSFPKSRLPATVPQPDDSWYERGVATNYAGAFPLVQRDYFTQVGMAMPSREWRDWLAHWTQFYLDQGSDGMYYDQFNMIYSSQSLYPDYPDSYGSWMRATLDTIRRLRDTSRPQNPFYTSSGEVCNDLNGQVLDVHMTSGVFNRLDLYRYCNPGQLLIDGNWNGGTQDRFGGQDRWRFIWQTGARFEGDPGAPVLKLRQTVKSHLYASTYMDTVGIQLIDGSNRPVGPTRLGDRFELGPVKGYSGRWFLVDHDDQRGAIINFISDPPAHNVKAMIETSRFGPVTTAWAWTLDGDFLPIRGKQTGTTYSFDVPFAVLSTVVLVNNLAPMVTWDYPHAVATDVPEALTLTLTNIMPNAISGEATIRKTEGVHGEGVSAFGPLASGESLSFALPFVMTDEPPQGLASVWADLQTTSGSFHAYAMPGVSKDLIADLRGGPGTFHVYLRNLTNKAIGGKLHVTSPAPLQAKVAERFDLPARGELRVPVQVTNQPALTAIAELKVTVQLGWRRKLDLVRAVLPAVPNGDFESDSAKDMKPDWWMCRKVRDRWAYERLHLTTDAHGGARALQLDPPLEGEAYSCAYPVHSVLAPYTRYRVSVWIRSKASDGVFLSYGNLRLGKGKTTEEWQEFSGEFSTNDRPGSFYRALYNQSTEPAFFDDILVQPLP